MKNTARYAISFLGLALMASQLFGAVNTEPLRQEGSSGAFEQTRPTTPAEKEADSLFKKISSNAAIASRHAEALESFTRAGSKLRSETHVEELIRAKEAINAIGSDFRRLQELRSSTLPWQQLVIDRMGPMLVGLAGSTTQALQLLNEDSRAIQLEGYRDAVVNMYAQAVEARNLIAVNLDYAEAREKLNRLDSSPVEQVANLSPAPRATWSLSNTTKSLEQRVQSELLKLPYYGTFDHLGFKVEGAQVALSGQVHWPTLKTDAERVVRGVEGVAVVTSTIEVLPLSPNDDSIRIAAYRAIYGHSSLSRYRLNPHPPIRIIVQNGHVTLMGVVGSDMDRTIAHLQANSVPGAFSVTNNLQIGN
jgi:hyperosmotically inducible protein